VADDDGESNPGTAAFVPDFGDDDDEFEPRPEPDPEPEVEPEPEPEEPGEPAGETPVASVTVPGRYQYLRWWKFLLVILGVWLAAAPVGLGLFYWWFHSIDKTWPVFIVLVYVVACSVAGVLLAMVQGRAVITALSLAIMSGPFASVAAAAPLYGYYYCERTGHCVFGVVPY
jgi:hypothetical protein